MRILSKPQLWIVLVLFVSQTSAAASRESDPQPAAGPTHVATTGGQFIKYPLPTVDAVPFEITIGPDGALWFTEFVGNKIGRITTSGVITEYPIPTQGSQPYGITAGPDGALWFTEYGGDNIGRITTGGVITEYPIPTQGSQPYGITAGPDGALWFTEIVSHNIGRITTEGVITEYLLPAPAQGLPRGITAGPDGALWYAVSYDESIGRITTGGVMTEYKDLHFGGAYDITAGPDGALWFTENYNIGRITTAGIITEYLMPTLDSPDNITTGPDGALWFTEPYGHKIGRITTEGAITEYPVPAHNSQPYGITAGPDGALWFTDSSLDNNCIWRLAPALALRVTADRTTVLATEMITATVVITNTGLEATSAVTLTLSEGEGMLYALRDEQDEGRFGTIAGRTNVIYFDALDFDPGEQKTFHIPLIISPLPNPDDESLPVMVTSIFSVTNASGMTAGAALTITANPLTGGPIDTSAFDSLPGQPVTDIGINPDAPLGASTSLAFAGLTGPLSVLAPPVFYPSDLGDLWSLYIVESLPRWSTKDRTLYFTLQRAGFTARSAYAAIYLHSLINLKPSGSCIPDGAEMARASVKFWAGLQKAKWWSGQADGFYSAFTDVAQGLGNCSALYPMNILELHSQYTTPMINATKDSFAAYSHNDVTMQQEIYEYITAGTPLQATPLPRLVEADVDYYLSRRQWHPILHNQIMSQVDIRRNGGGTIKLGTAIYELMNCTANIAYNASPPCPKGYRKPWTALQVHSPLLPLVTDSQGRRSGLDAPSGQLYDEIPGMVIEPGHPWVLLLPATTGLLQVQWTTAYPYQFGIDVQGIYSGTLTSQSSSAGFAAADFTANQTITVTVGSSSVTVSASPVTADILFLPLIVR